MGKQRKHTLTIDHDYDYEMIGICSHHNDYRLVWGINSALNLNLEKADKDFVVDIKKGHNLSSHSLYEFKDPENLVEYYLIKNKNEGKFLIPEKQDIDYFLFLHENYIDNSSELIQKLKSVSSVLAVFNFNPEEINSTENLVFN
jgi:hypothetical protein